MSLFKDLSRLFFLLFLALMLPAAAGAEESSAVAPATAGAQATAPIAKSADPTDGMLDLRLFPPKSMFQFVRHFAGIILNRHEKHPLVQCLKAKKIRVECDREVPAQVDGDPAGFTPATVEVHPMAFKVLVPKMF